MKIEREDHQYKNGDYKRYYTVDENRVFGFFEDYRFLSNFHKCDIHYDGERFPSSEHAYMCAKCKNIETVNYEKHYNGLSVGLIRLMSCSEVKKWGRKVELRDDWEQIKVGVMLQINLDKYIRNIELREKLLATGDKILIESNSWGDSFWGFDVDKNKGENNLGKILMNVRGLLKNHGN